MASAEATGSPERRPAVYPPLPQLEDLPVVAGKRVLVRCDFNVGVRRGRVVNDLRIRAATPTLEWLVRRGAQVTVCTHLGRPGGRRDPRWSLVPVRDLLADLVPEVEMMENLRFDPGETANDAGFVARLVAGQDLYVNDAFATAHRAHASVVGPPALLPSAAGRLLSREVAVLSALRVKARRPFVVILGGGADPERLGSVAHLCEFVDVVVLGGPIAYASMTAGTASAEILARLAPLVAAGRVLLPPDVLLTRIDDPSQFQVSEGIPPGWKAVDIGHRSSARFAALIGSAGTVFWDGAMSGEGFIRGTRGVAEAVASTAAFSVVSGAETMQAIERLDLSAFIDHASTGGAAGLRFLQDGDLPGLRALRR